MLDGGITQHGSFTGGGHFSLLKCFWPSLSGSVSHNVFSLFSESRYDALVMIEDSIHTSHIYRWHLTVGCFLFDGLVIGDDGRHHFCG